MHRLKALWKLLWLLFAPSALIFGLIAYIVQGSDTLFIIGFILVGGEHIERKIRKVRTDLYALYIMRRVPPPKDGSVDQTEQKVRRWFDQFE